VCFASQALPQGGFEDALQSFVDLGGGLRLHLVDGALLAVHDGLPLVHFILFGVHDVLFAIHLRLELIDASLFFVAAVHQTLLAIDFSLRAIHVRLMAVDAALQAIHFRLMAIYLRLPAIDFSLGGHGVFELGQDTAVSHDVVAAILPEPGVVRSVLGAPRFKGGSSWLSHEPLEESPETIR
jgi:hypothetical protein